MTVTDELTIPMKTSEPVDLDFEVEDNLTKRRKFDEIEVKSDNSIKDKKDKSIFRGTLLI
ncbi:hypothetical protein GGF49_006123, partial [Coemansia sp. RSA 1853]